MTLALYQLFDFQGEGSGKFPNAGNDPVPNADSAPAENHWGFQDLFVVEVLLLASTFHLGLQEFLRTFPKPGIV